MAIEAPSTKNLQSPTTNRIYVAITIFTVLLGLLGALCIPFMYESASIGYKLGFDKHLLRAGKMAGLVAMVLLLLQLPLAGRLKFLDRIFGLPALYRIHRFGAWTLGLVALVHPILVFAPDGMLMIPFEARYWPEWIGAVLLLAIWCQIVLSNWRRSFLPTYERWRLCHRSLGVVVLMLVFVHVLFVSDTFEVEDLPRWAVMAVACCSALLWGWVRLQAAHRRRALFKVEQVEQVGQDAYAVELVPTTSRRFCYLPGQFAFISFDSTLVADQVHPFTLSSTPTRPNNLQMTIKRSGDWTAGIGNLKAGDTAYLQGPFGRFSHLLEQPQREIIMIAGGIGITPMLSMLRYMQDQGDGRPITLIWSNQTKQHQFNENELDLMGQQLTSFHWIPIFTRETDADAKSGRLDRQKLDDLLKNCSRNAVVYLCGPPAMISNVRALLRQSGFSSGTIKQEAFNL